MSGDEQCQDLLGSALNRAGYLYSQVGQYDLAIEFLRQSLEISRAMGDDADIATDLGSIGTVYISWGQYDKAMEHFQQALEIPKKSGPEADASLNINIGTTYIYLDQYDKALEYFQQALEISKKSGKETEITASLNGIGSIYDSLDQYDKALEYFQQALEIARKSGKETEIATPLGNIGLVYSSLDQEEKAIEYYQQALEIFRKFDMEDKVATILGNIGSSYWSLGQYDNAIENFRSSIDLLEKIRKTAVGDARRDYLASQIYTYQHLTEAYLKTNAPQDVLKSIEQSRARTLAEKIAGIGSELSTPTLDEVKKGLNDDEAILIFSNINQNNFILMVVTGSDVLLKEISKDNFLAQTRKLYKENILLLLEKQRGRVIPREKEKDFLLEKDTEARADFDRSAGYYRMALIQSAKEYQRGLQMSGAKNNAQPHFKDFARLLYDLLIKPAEGALAGKKKLIIMPDGILGFLPFETLINQNNQYLAEQYDIAYTQSLTISRLLDSRLYDKGRKPMLALGGAVYDETGYEAAEIENEAQLAYLEKQTFESFEQSRSLRNSYRQLGMAEWKNLPGTLSEVNNISGIVNGADILTGDAVTEKAVKKLSEKGKLADYKVLHFATHGLVVPAVPELSAIVLSQFKEEKDEEDGYLRMGEIAKLNLEADFVNLSACETGLGKVYGGEGVVGLTQSFLIAGANGLSVSLWQVADDSTSKFMTELYKKVNSEGISHNQALIDVKREFISGKFGEKWKAPYFWAPFVYYGN